MRVTSSLAKVSTPTAVALGNFDGIHQGHRQVILPTVKNEGWQGAETVGEAYSTVVTFHPHPQEFFTGTPRCLLTPLDEKVAQLQAMGVEQLVLLPFNHQLANLTPQAFVETILVNGLQARRVSVGLDFCFGRRRAGSTRDLCAIAATYGVEVAIAPLKLLDGHRISSSVIRQALQEGNMQQANYSLGRPYSLVGTVIQGQQLGRSLGFPTANLQLPAEKFLPHYGVYAVQVQICDRPDQLPPPSAGFLNGVMNLGMRPTVDGTRLVAEVHLFDWSEDLYSRILSVTLEHFLRPEQKFGSLNELKAQIQIDCESAKQFLSEIH